MNLEKTAALIVDALLCASGEVGDMIEVKKIDPNRWGSDLVLGCYCKESAVEVVYKVLEREWLGKTT